MREVSQKGPEKEIPTSPFIISAASSSLGLGVSIPETRERRKTCSSKQTDLAHNKQLIPQLQDNDYNLLRSLRFARGIENTQDLIFAVVLLSEEIQMFKIARETGEVTEFRPPITNFAPGMTHLEYMDNKPKTNFWFLSYHTYQTTLSTEVATLDEPIPQGDKGFFKVEITPDAVNTVFFNQVAELHQSVYFMDTPDSDKFFTTEKELDLEAEFHLKFYSTSTNTHTLLKSQSIGLTNFYQNSEFLTSISAVALNKPFTEEIHFYDESLTKKG